MTKEWEIKLGWKSLPWNPIFACKIVLLYIHKILALDSIDQTGNRGSGDSTHIPQVLVPGQH